MPSIVLPEGQQRLLDWLLDPRQPSRGPKDTHKGSQNELADTLGVDKSALSKWKKDPRFRQAQAEQVLELAGGPETLHVMLQALVEIGQDKAAPPAARVSAIGKYLEVTEKNTPRPTVKVEDPSLLNADNQELLDRAMALADRIKEARRSIGLQRDGKAMADGQG